MASNNKAVQTSLKMDVSHVSVCKFCSNDEFDRTEVENSPQKYRNFFLDPDEQDLFNDLKRLINRPDNFNTFETQVSIMESVTVIFQHLSLKLKIIDELKVKKKC